MKAITASSSPPDMMTNGGHVHHTDDRRTRDEGRGTTDEASIYLHNGMQPCSDGGGGGGGTLCLSVWATKKSLLSSLVERAGASQWAVSITCCICIAGRGRPLYP